MTAHEICILRSKLLLKSLLSYKEGSSIPSKTIHDFSCQVLSVECWYTLKQTWVEALSKPIFSKKEIFNFPDLWSRMVEATVEDSCRQKNLYALLNDSAHYQKNKTTYTLSEISNFFSQFQHILPIEPLLNEKNFIPLAYGDVISLDKKYVTPDFVKFEKVPFLGDVKRLIEPEEKIIERIEAKYKKENIHVELFLEVGPSPLVKAEIQKSEIWKEIYKPTQFQSYQSYSGAFITKYSSFIRKIPPAEVDLSPQKDYHYSSLSTETYHSYLIGERKEIIKDIQKFIDKNDYNDPE